MIPLFHHKKNRQFQIHTYADAAPGTMLVDSFDRTVGTPVRMPYTELVMYTHSSDKVLIEHYSNGGTDDERCDRFLVPIAQAQAVFDVIRKSGMAGWNARKDTIGICGRSYVCKFPDGEGGYTRVTSDRMPDDGTAAFGEVKAAMYALCRPEYRTESDKGLSHL